MTTAMMLVDVILGMESNEEIVSYLKCIKTSLNYLNFLILNLLDFKLIMDGNFKPNLNVFDIRASIKFVLDILDIQASVRKVKVQMKVIGSDRHDW